MLGLHGRDRDARVVAEGQEHGAGREIVGGGLEAEEGGAAVGEGVDAARAAVRAEAALDRCIRRRAFPDRARALRGRLRYSLGRHVEAEIDLVAARAAFADADLADPGTDLMLAAIMLADERDAAALPLDPGNDGLSLYRGFLGD